MSGLLPSYTESGKKSLGINNFRGFFPDGVPSPDFIREADLLHLYGLPVGKSWENEVETCCTVCGQVSQMDRPMFGCSYFRTYHTWGTRIIYKNPFGFKYLGVIQTDSMFKVLTDNTAFELNIVKNPKESSFQRRFHRSGIYLGWYTQMLMVVGLMNSGATVDVSSGSIGKLIQAIERNRSEK